VSSDSGHHPDPTAVVVVSYRTAALTHRAVSAALADGAAEVIVVDNASGDDTVATLRTITDPRLVVIENDRNAGFGIAANQGARLASADTLVFLNSDAAPRPGALAVMASAVAARDGCVIIGPRLVGDDGEVQRSAGLVPRPDDLVIRGLGLHRLARILARIPVARRAIGASRIATEYDQAVTTSAAIDVSMVSGACVAVGRTAFLELGGFDERYFMYFEDADLCRRAARAGWPIRYVPDAIVDHVGGASSTGDYRFGPRHAASMVRYLRDWHGPAGTATALGILWLRALGETVLFRPDAARARRALGEGLAVAAGRA
jgi:GT2 family glycosyltransferase